MGTITGFSTKDPAKMMEVLNQLEIPSEIDKVKDLVSIEIAGNKFVMNEDGKLVVA